MRTFYILMLLFISLTACKQSKKNIKTVDFSEVIPLEASTFADSEKKPLKVAVAAILSPRETFSSYEDIIGYIGSRLDMPVEFHQRKTYLEINDMLEKGVLDFAFICSGAYVELDKNSGVELLSAPVSHGKPFYQAYIIVPANSKYQRLTDLKGLSFAYTDVLSNTGYLYARYRLKEEGEDPDTFFSSTIFTHAHDVSIQMVAKGLVEGATIDGLVFDYLKTKDPERVKDIRIIEFSEYFGIPPVVASSHMDNALKVKVKEILSTIHLDEEGRELINAILIDKFIDGKDSDYNSVRKMRAKVGN